MTMRRNAKPALLFPLFVSWAGAAAGAPLKLEISQGVELSWSTLAGPLYQVQKETGGVWADAGSPVDGDGEVHSFFLPDTVDAAGHQVLEIAPGGSTGPAIVNAVVNGGFETGSGPVAEAWSTGAGQPPARTGAEARLGSFCMRAAIANVGATPGEGHLQQRLLAGGSPVSAGQSYDFSFWAKQVSAGPSYVQQYEMRWLDAAGNALGGTGLKSFSGTTGEWQRFAAEDLVAPSGTADARVFFRFVTGAVEGGGGEVLLDDIALEGPGEPETTGPPTISIHPFNVTRIAAITWSTVAGIDYQPRVSPDLGPANWSDLTAPVPGDGNPKTLRVPLTSGRRFFRVEYPLLPPQAPAGFHTVHHVSPNAIGLAWEASASPEVTGYRIRYGTSPDDMPESLDVGTVTSAALLDLVPGQTYFVSIAALTADGGSSPGSAPISARPGPDPGIVPLHDATTPPEPAVTIDTPAALITRLSDRVRDRHAREGNFQAYDHYLSWYWEQRTAEIEIIDRIPKGGSEITVNFTTLAPLNPAEFRAFFRGIGTVAEYHHNVVATLVSTSPSAIPGETDHHYSTTISTKLPENRPLQTGDRMEMEISQFLLDPRHGRSNYYGTAILYVVGEGIVPWQAQGPLLDSFPLPQIAWLGGRTTLPYQYSNEPEHRFKQTAGNLSPRNGQPFMLGRRLHHTDFGNGSHSEPGNPAFAEHAGSLGPKYAASSCIACHGNNGRALPPAIGASLLAHGVKVGGDASGSAHPLLGEQLQPKATGTTAEAGATLAGYTTTDGVYDDGTGYSLRKPVYAFEGVTPDHHSVRIAPQLVGLGLLEAVGETTVLDLADPDDSDQDGISGRIHVIDDPETGQPRLGRFGYKATQARVVHQIAHALNRDIGVASAIFPILDGEATPSPAEIGAEELDQMNRYVSLLGVGARRDLTDAQALLGEQLFQAASCAACHVPTLATGSHHPMAELRDQTIHPFTDLLLHDMGPGLADNMGEEDASGSEWRTTPLWGVGLTAGVSGGEAYLHDGRARTLEEAILWHGGEAEASRQAFVAMSAAERAALVKFLKSL